ncbi:hypothetical protein II1_05111 [Bacillus cereus MC118]|uniref:Uncharacterized protein n=1 Tax=Bacillus cereus MC67 TaxID=1053219 RepID=J8EI25_BACCE|nr:hypothetical protein II3_05614 [Bacillus cereus MC67]EOP00628.1 hypothetical protein II1_05111 [Bacillus cereus MC118]
MTYPIDKSFLYLNYQQYNLTKPKNKKSDFKLAWK